MLCRNFVSLFVLILILAAITACERRASPAVDEPAAELAEVDATHRFVQDLWVIESLASITDRGAIVDHTEAIVEYLTEHRDRSQVLLPDVTFHVVDLLDPFLGIPDDESDPAGPRDMRRDDVEVVAGLIEHEGDMALAILATPQRDAEHPVGVDDELSFDLSFLENLTPGAPLIVDYAFLQGHPSSEDPTEVADGLALLADRMAREEVTFFGLSVDGGVEILLYHDQLGIAHHGSVRGSLPAKSDDMMDGFRSGLRRCGFNLSCVARFFRSFGGGAQSSLDQICNNMSVNCPPPSPAPRCRRNCGRSTGEPHLRTFDGARYDMMAVGEFIALGTETLEVQLRTQPWMNRSSISIGTAVAIGLGGHRITIDKNVPAHRRIQIDGEPVSAEELRAGAHLLGDARVLLSGSTLQVIAGEEIITVTDVTDRGRINLYASLPDGITSRGLLGTNSGDQGDDFTTREGEVLTGLPADRDGLYDNFVSSWRISQEESLFDYEPGRDTAYFTDLDFPEFFLTLDDLDSTTRRRAAALCREAGISTEDALYECIFDVGFTGDPSFARVARQNDIFDRIADGLLAPFSPVQGGDLGETLGGEGNLIHNGDAELGPATSLASQSRETPEGWEDLTGQMWISAYGEGAGGPLADAPSRGQSENYFWGGHARTSAITQTRDISHHASAVDGGGVQFVLSGRIGGWTRQNDRADLLAEFLDDDATVLGLSRIGPVTNEDRRDQTGMIHLVDQSRLPPGTRAVRFTLTANRAVGRNNDGYADELFFGLFAGNPDTQGLR